MEAKVGDRVALDGKKIGQPRRTGVIRGLSKGLSGIRYQIAWDDGHESVLAPGAGNLTIEGRSDGNSNRARPRAKAKSGAKPRAKTTKRKAKTTKRKAKTTKRKAKTTKRKASRRR